MLGFSCTVMITWEGELLYVFFSVRPSSLVINPGAGFSVPTSPMEVTRARFTATSLSGLAHCVCSQPWANWPPCIYARPKTRRGMVLLTQGSRAPTSGGQYHWVSMLAPPRAQKFFSYIIGQFALRSSKPQAKYLKAGWSLLAGKQLWLEAGFSAER
jgi:hypothetical protein